MTLRPVKRKLHMKQKSSLRGRVEGWENTEINKEDVEEIREEGWKECFCTELMPLGE